MSRGKWFLMLISVSAIVITTLLVWKATTAPHVQEDTIELGGTARRYRIVVPPSATKPTAIVFAFHGVGDTPDSMANYSKFDQLAAAHGFILVYPAARRSMWATENIKFDELDSNRDIQFFDPLLSKLAAQHDIDREQLLAHARADVIAAVAAQSGHKPRTVPTPAKPFPILLIVGAEDPAADAIEADAATYRKAGHRCELFVSRGLAIHGRFRTAS